MIFFFFGFQDQRSSFNMKPVPVMLLVAFVVGVQGQDLSPRTFAFFPSGPADQQGHHHHNAHPHQHGSHATQTQGNHNPVLSAHQPHAGHAHQVPANVHPSHVFPVHHNSHEHVHNHRPSPAAGNANTVPVLVCRVVHVPAPPAPSSSGTGSVVPPTVFGNITTTLETVVGTVVDPVVSLLHNASVWLNRTAHRRPFHGNHVHPHQHHSSVSAVDAVHHKVLALNVHKNPTHPGSGHSQETHAIPTATSPAWSVTTVAAATEASSPAGTTKARAPAQVLTSTVGAPAPRLLTETSFTPSTIEGTVSPFTEIVFDPTPRSQSAPSQNICPPLTLRCAFQFRRDICRQYEQCLLDGPLRGNCMAVLIYQVFIDKRCTPA
ncbi:uncharacterized protein LOC144174248 [Haemaphysalis longicornis]